MNFQDYLLAQNLFNYPDRFDFVSNTEEKPEDNWYILPIHDVNYNYEKYIKLYYCLDILSNFCGVKIKEFNLRIKDNDFYINSNNSDVNKEELSEYIMKLYLCMPTIDNLINLMAGSNVSYLAGTLSYRIDVEE